jgi:hypothetical protein
MRPAFKRRRPLELFHDLFTLGDDALDCFTGLAACRLAEKLEYLIQAFDLRLSFVAVLQETCLAFLGLGGAGHFRQCLQDLLFREIDVLESIKEKVIKGFGGAGRHV